MKKKGSWTLPVIVVLAIVIIRIVYAVLGSQTITDSYGFFSHAMIQEQEREPLLSSGIAYAYTENLSDILKFTGNRIEIIGIYQIVLLILWLLLFFFGTRLLLGNTMACVSTLLLAAWPWGALNPEVAVACENYLMLYWTLMLLLLGIFQNRVRVSGWTRSNFCELYLMLTGFGIGVVTAWNYMGLLLFPVIIYVLVCNHGVMRERAWRKEWEEEVKESRQQMSLISQGAILFAGAFLGILATLLKYTGLTGYVLFEQFFWWLDQFHNFPERCQDISGILLFVIAAAVVAGGVCRLFARMIQRQAESKRAFREAESRKEVPEPEAEKEETEKEERLEETAGEPKVKLLDNPLPVPPKPEIKDMDFDIAISDDDDFDV